MWKTMKDACCLRGSSEGCVASIPYNSNLRNRSELQNTLNALLHHNVGRYTCLSAAQYLLFNDRKGCCYLAAVPDGVGLTEI